MTQIIAAAVFPAEKGPTSPRLAWLSTEAAVPIAELY